jgi:hypothetical protein
VCFLFACVSPLAACSAKATDKARRARKSGHGDQQRNEVAEAAPALEDVQPAGRSTAPTLEPLSADVLAAFAERQR